MIDLDKFDVMEKVVEDRKYGKTWRVFHRDPSASDFVKYNQLIAKKSGKKIGLTDKFVEAQTLARIDYGLKLIVGIQDIDGESVSVGGVRLPNGKPDEEFDGKWREVFRDKLFHVASAISFLVFDATVAMRPEDFDEDEGEEVGDEDPFSEN